MRKKPLRNDRRSATVFERTVESEKCANRFRFTAFDKIGNAMPSERIRYATRHRDKIAHGTGGIRCGQLIAPVLSIIGIARRMSMIETAVRRFPGTRHQAVDRVFKHKRRDRHNDHDKHRPLVFESETHDSVRRSTGAKRKQLYCSRCTSLCQQGFWRNGCRHGPSSSLSGNGNVKTVCPKSGL